MSTKNGTPTSVENVIGKILADVPVKSLVVINDVVAGEIIGAVDDTDHEHELAAGVVYVLVGLGDLPTSAERGINFVDLPKGK